jgi:hypothetical protein
MQFEPVIRMPTAWTSLAGRFSLHVFEGELTVDDMNEMKAIGDRWFARRPGKLVELTIVFPSNTRMSAEERTRMTQLIKHWEHHRVASGTVILADGLVGAMQRSVLTGLLMLAPPPHPSKIFGKIPEAMTWLAPHIRALCGAGATREAALAAVESECAAFKSR